VRPRPNPFLERRAREREAARTPPPSQPGRWAKRLQAARDNLSLLLAVSSAATAALTWWALAAGPRPQLADMLGEPITLLRSDQVVGDEARRPDGSRPPRLPLLNDAGESAEFPVLLAQFNLFNIAPSGQNTLVRRLSGRLMLREPVQGEAYALDLEWTMLTTSTSEVHAGVEHLVVGTLEQPAAFVLPGAGGWSREVLLVPVNRYKNRGWHEFATRIARCVPGACHIIVTLRAHFVDGTEQARVCRLSVGEHVRNNVAGGQRRFFSVPVCQRP
jgi:hypothetical protein